MGTGPQSRRQRLLPDVNANQGSQSSDWESLPLFLLLQQVFIRQKSDTCLRDESCACETSLMAI
jgi:hypothetical protein